jgi:hypothetical protein
MAVQSQLKGHFKMQAEEIKIERPVYKYGADMIIQQGTAAAALLNTRIEYTPPANYFGNLTFEYRTDNDMAYARKITRYYSSPSINMDRETIFERNARTDIIGMWNGQKLDEKSAWWLFEIMENITDGYYIGTRKSGYHYGYVGYGRQLSKADRILAHAFRVRKSELTGNKTFEELEDGRHPLYMKRCLETVSKMLREETIIKIPSETLSTCENVREFHKMCLRQMFPHSR